MLGLLPVVMLVSLLLFQPSGALAQSDPSAPSDLPDPPSAAPRSHNAGGSPYSSSSQFNVLSSNQITVLASNWQAGVMAQVDLTLKDPADPDLSQWNQVIAAKYQGKLPGSPNVVGGGWGRLDPTRDSVAIASFFTTGSGAALPPSIVERIALAPSASRSYDVQLPVPEPTALSYLRLTTALLDPSLNAKMRLQKHVVAAQLAWSGSAATLQVTVLDSSFGSLAQWSGSVTATQVSRLDLAAGDLDGDGLDEIITVHQQASGEMALMAFSLDRSGATPSLRKLAELVVNGTGELVRAVAVGDFDFDYVAEIAVVSIRPSDAEGFHGSGIVRGLYLTAANTLAVVGQAVELDVDALVAPNTDAEVGVLALDSSRSNPLMGRQLATAFVNSDGYLQVMVHRLDINKLENQFSAQQLGVWSGAFDGFNPVRTTQGPFLGVGNYEGLASSDGTLNPTMQLAVAAAVPQGLDPDTTAAPHVYLFDVDQGAIAAVPDMPIVVDLGPEVETVDSITLLPADLKGESLYLGTPVHLHVDQLVDPRYVIQSPPKHVDFLPEDPDNPADWNDQSQWAVVNVSAFPNFYVELTTKTSGTIATSSSDSASTETSSSKSYDISAGLAGEFAGFAPFGVSADYKHQVTESASQTETVKDFSSDTSSVTLSCKTSYWDQLVGFSRSLDVWRYPAYNLPGHDQPSDRLPWIEIVLPGPVSSGPNDQLDGISVDWYQPQPIINYLISYPPSLPTLPSDIGEFSFIRDGKEVKRKEWIGTWNNSVFGNAKSVELQWSHESGSSSEKKYETTYATSDDLKIGFTAKRAFGFVDFNLGGSVSFNWSKKSSWSHSDLSSAQLTESQGITLNIPAGNVSGANGYQISTGAYISAHGELKVVHAASIPGTSLPWWYARYGHRPDPGLNLPKRLVSSSSGWKVETDPAQSQQMRGFAVQYSEPNPLTGELGYVGIGLQDGDSLLLTAVVYNLSLGQKVEDLEVLFQYQEMKADGQTKVGAPVEIGTVTLPAMDAQATAIAQTAWKVSRLAGKFVRVYVTLDPNDKIENEVHELGAIASNNVGYWPQGSAVPVFSPSAPVALPEGDDISAGSSALGLRGPDGDLVTDLAEVQVGSLVTLEATFESTSAAREHRLVLFYEGDPQAGGRAFASRVLRGVVEGTNVMTVDWLPEDASVEAVAFRIFENSGEKVAGNAEDLLPVRVRAAE